MTDPQQRFQALYADHGDAILGYALRRCRHPEDAADVMAETFLVAWRRLERVPHEPETRMWLYATARRVMANQLRGERRRDALGGRLREELSGVVPDQTPEAAHRIDIARAIDELPERDREVLALHLWEGLEPRDIATVLDLSALAVRPRLSRAKARLRARLGPAWAEPPGRATADHAQTTLEEA